MREKRQALKRNRLMTQDPAKIIQFLPDAKVLAVEYLPSRRQAPGGLKRRT